MIKKLKGLKSKGLNISLISSQGITNFRGSGSVLVAHVFNTYLMLATSHSLSLKAAKRNKNFLN